MSQSKKHAVGIICNSPWEMTEQTLRTIVLADESKDNYDLYIIDNTANSEHMSNMKEWVRSQTMPVAGLISLTKNIYLSKAANLFLNLTQEYDFRTYVASGIAFTNMPPVSKKAVKTSDANVARMLRNPGAPQSVSILRGAGHKPDKKVVMPTKFLEHMESDIKKKNTGIMALVSIPQGHMFRQMWQVVHARTWRGHPCITGRCWMITKSCFDKIGYFDERLPAFIDFEYSQRAMSNGINVGYVYNYWVTDYSSKLVESENNQRNELLAGQALMMDNGVKQDKLETQWKDVQARIRKQLATSKILTME